MDVAEERKASTRQHGLKAAQAAGLPRAGTKGAIDELLGLATPDVLQALAQDLILRASTVSAVHQAMQSHHALLAR